MKMAFTSRYLISYISKLLCFRYFFGFGDKQLLRNFRHNATFDGTGRIASYVRIGKPIVGFR